MIFLPATAALLLTLVVVFRSLRDAAISIGVLVTALALVNAFVAGTGTDVEFPQRNGDPVDRRARASTTAST